jgi:hypothetical protein
MCRAGGAGGGWRVAGVKVKARALGQREGYRRHFRRSRRYGTIREDLSWPGGTTNSYRTRTINGRHAYGDTLDDTLGMTVLGIRFGNLPVQIWKTNG